MPDIEVSRSHTRSLKYRLTHTWLIDNFSHFCRPDPTLMGGAHLTSPSFACSQNEAIQFDMEVFPGNFPKGRSEEFKDYVSVRFFVTFTEEKAANVPIHFKCSLLDEANRKKYKHENMFVFLKSTGWGWPKFVKRSLVLDPTTGLLVNDQLRILCEIELYCAPAPKLTGDASLENLKSLAIGKNNEILGNLLESGDHSDVVLVVDGDELKAHKAILSAHSPVFRAMFECDMKEKAEGRVVIEGLTADVAKELLKFIYTGSVDLQNSSAGELLSAADKYGLDLLKQLCGQYLCGKVSTDTVARLLALAEAHSVDTLKRTCMKYIRAHMEVMLTPDWHLVEKLVIEEMRQGELSPGEDEEGGAEELSPGEVIEEMRQELPQEDDDGDSSGESEEDGEGQ